MQPDYPYPTRHYEDYICKWLVDPRTKMHISRMHTIKLIDNPFIFS